MKIDFQALSSGNFRSVIVAKPDSNALKGSPLTMPDSFSPRLKSPLSSPFQSLPFDKPPGGSILPPASGLQGR
jgi:hypothetical protein